MKNPKMIIFDYGNTLIFEKELNLNNGFKALYKKLAKNINKIPYHEFYKTGSELLEWTQDITTKNNVEIHIHQFYNLFFQKLNISSDLPYLEIETVFWEAIAPCEPMPNIKSFLNFLNKKQIKTAVISNIAFSGKALTKRINTYLPENNFEFIMASSEYGIRKPEKLIFEAAIKKSGLNANEIWYCGDNLYADIIGANAAGITPILFKPNLKCPYDNNSDTVPNFEFKTISDWSELQKMLC